MPEIQRDKISKALVGNKNSIGYKHTEKAKDKISKSRIGNKNSQWKGNKVGYVALHSWVKRRLPNPKKCGFCKKYIDRLDLANISQEYRRDVSDWEWLCRKCHMTKDGRLSKLEIFSKIKKLDNKTCKLCGKTYHPRSKTSDFCSHGCHRTFANLNRIGTHYE